MYLKLALRNIRRSVRDYAVYFITLLFGVAVFYAFNSIGSQQILFDMETSASRSVFDSTTYILGMFSVVVACVLGFLILYANQFLIRRRKREFGTYLVLGMTPGHVSRIVLYETVLVGLLSLAVGLICGVLLSQGLSFFTAALFGTTMTNYQFVFSPDAFLVTLACFAAIYVVVAAFNTITVSRCKLIDLIRAGEKNERAGVRNPWVCLVGFVSAVAILVYAYEQLIENGLVGMTKVRKHYWTSGLVTDDSMADQIIQQYESMKSSSDKPIFLHAVTMQNHTNYNKDNYPDDERVKVLSHPAGLKPSTVGALEDFATGIRDADAMLGKLTEYFSQVDEPVILVFWGDHYNPIDSNYDVYTTTGYASDSSADPRLHQTTLLMWSNYSQQQVDLGTIAAYDISPVMMDIYGLEEPLYFQFLDRQLRVASRTNTRGTTMNLDGTTTQEPTEFQQRWCAEHWLLQYDLMFGRGYALQRMGLAGLSGVDTGK